MLANFPDPRPNDVVWFDESVPQKDVNIPFTVECKL